MTIERSLLKEGVLVKIKNNITMSAKMYGMNHEKESFAGQLKTVKKIERKAVKVFRDPEKVLSSYRNGRDYWTFHITDIELGFDPESIEKLEKEKTVKHVFNPEQLMI